MCCSINTALHSIAVKFSPCLTVCVEEIYIVWRVAICRVWRVPLTTHCKLQPQLANRMDIEFWFSRRCMRFIKMAMNSSDIVVKTISNVGIYVQIKFIYVSFYF